MLYTNIILTLILISVIWFGANIVSGITYLQIRINELKQVVELFRRDYSL
jgi:hypothetical protein